MAKKTALFVLDLETSVDPRAAAIAHHKARGKKTPWAIRKIDAACVLTAVFSDQAECSRVDLVSFDGQGSTSLPPEAQILVDIERVLAVSDPDAEQILCTFNGDAFDIPLLQLRAQRHGLFHADNLLRVARSHDAMVVASTFSSVPWPSLRQVAASLGIPAFPLRSSKDVQVPDRRIIKCETDVCATFLVSLAQLAWERGTGRMLEEGKLALVRAIRRMYAPGLHLRQFTRIKN